MYTNHENMPLQDFTLAAEQMLRFLRNTCGFYTPGIFVVKFLSESTDKKHLVSNLSGYCKGSDLVNESALISFYNSLDYVNSKLFMSAVRNSRF